MSDPHHGPPIVVVGGANVDVKLTVTRAVVPGTSNPGRARIASGGVGRNIAHNLALLGSPVALVSVVGTDDPAGSLVRETRDAGVDVGAVVARDAPTGIYAAVLGPDGDLVIGVSAMEGIEGLAPADIDALAGMIGGAAAIVADCNLTEETLERVGEVAAAAGRILVVDGVSSPKVLRVRRLLGAGHPLRALLCNRDEIAALSGIRTGDDASLQAAVAMLHDAGVQGIVVGLGADGALVSERGRGTEHLRAPAAVVVDVTGAGDAAAAATVHRLVAGDTLGRAARWGQAAAALTIATASTVAELSAAALDEIVNRGAARP